ncbi:uncharacterized protein LOC111056376 isoform X2 [Nilaparvata lugens]|uniref:uncharacterized protein LOC111056376 isoform X2 n=1 Tax=Nilaparvata lugens TaxID=108931 RepID=UPI00193E271E|nr:uncharacterized protein LOC111056376 isoform X2 [Nilaparvata lugens]
MTSEAKVETLPKSIRSSGGTVPQMFGIYRARTPDEKLDPPSPGRHTRALFLSAVVTGVALVVGLTLLDVSTNSSNLKSTPVLHLTRHRQDLFVVDARASEAPDIQGTVEEINDTASEPSVTTVVNITDIVTTEVANEEKSENSKENNDKVRTARTQLFPIESLKRHRTQYVKDYFVDGKHDPQSLGYYILQKQNGEYYLRNYSEPMWGTRIRRRFSNRMYPPPPLGADPYQFARRSDNFETRYHFYGGPPRIDRFRQPPIDRVDHGKKNLQTMTTLRKYFNPYSKRVETGLPQTYSAFGRSDKPFAPTPNTDGEDSNPPHYQFTPIPVFSDAYAQLDPYKNNREIKSMKDIVKYLTTSTSLPRLQRTTTTTTTTQATITSLESFQNEEGEKEEDSFEDLLTTSSAAKVTRLKPPSNTNFNWKEPTYQPPPKRVNRKRGMRISGTYRMPIEPEDLRTGASGLVETLVPPPMHPFMFIANTTEPDPFAKFRPLDPSEINQLAAPRPLRPPGSMFMNNIRPISGKPNQYFPKPPHDRNPVRQGISLNPNHSPSHTVALFKQNGSSGRQKYHQSGFGKKKPVSVTLDIYPMTMDSEQGYQQDEGIGLPIKYDEKPLNDEWSPRNPDTSNGQQMDSQGSDNHMVVHLNVYPKGITSNLRTGIGRQAFWNPPLPIAAYQKRAMTALKDLMEFAVEVS